MSKQKWLKGFITDGQIPRITRPTSLGIQTGRKIGRGGFPTTVVVAAPTYQTPAYANQYGSGNRALTLGSLFSTSFVTDDIWSVLNLYFEQLVNGDTTTNTGYLNPNATPVAGARMMVDFTTLGTSFKVTEMKIYFDGTMDAGVWRPIEYRNGAWAVCGANFTLGASAAQTIDMSLSQGGTRYGIEGVSGNCSWDRYWREIEFKIGAQN